MLIRLHQLSFVLTCSKLFFGAIPQCIGLLLSALAINYPTGGKTSSVSVALAGHLMRAAIEAQAIALACSPHAASPIAAVYAFEWPPVAA